MKAPLSRLVTNLALGSIVLILLAQFWIFAAALEMAHDSAHKTSTPLWVVSGAGCAVIWALIALLVRREGQIRKVNNGR